MTGGAGEDIMPEVQGLVVVPLVKQLLKLLLSDEYALHVVVFTNAFGNPADEGVRKRVAALHVSTGPTPLVGRQGDFSVLGTMETVEGLAGNSQAGRAYRTQISENLHLDLIGDCCEVGNTGLYCRERVSIHSIVSGESYYLAGPELPPQAPP